MTAGCHTLAAAARDLEHDRELAVADPVLTPRTSALLVRARQAVADLVALGPEGLPALRALAWTIAATEKNSAATEANP